MKPGLEGKAIIFHFYRIDKLASEEKLFNFRKNGDKESEVTSVLIALDCTEEILEEAISHKCNLIITHHPLIFSKLNKITGSNYIERIIIKAIKHDISHP